MNLKEIHLKAGSILDYLGYIILMFGLNFIFDTFSLLVPETSGAAYQIIGWGLKFLVGPIVYAVVFAGIYERQTVQDDLERKNFFSHIKMHALRFIIANLLSTLIYFMVMMIDFFINGEGATSLSSRNLVIAVLSAAFSTLMVFWYSALVVEPKFFRSCIHALKTLLTHPAAFVIGIIWFGACAADSMAFDYNTQQTPLAINLVRSGAFALLKTFAVMYILVIYKNAWGGLIQRMQAAEILKAPNPPRPGEGLAKVGLGFAFFSFVPFLHLVALGLGIASLKKSRRFILKAAIAGCVGGFFTILYALMLVGYLAGQANAARMPGYSFITDSSAEMQPYVDLLDKGAFEDVRAELDDSSANGSSRHWTLDAALALAKYKGHDLTGALKDFNTALQKKPERSEFYFYYGLALLDSNNAALARDQFQLALNHEPKLDIAKQYLSLVQNLFQPDVISSAIIYLVILFLLFTFHEYGHAFAAWKLGDDTAKNEGRLTLNPIAHLDLFGSILLPAILLFQQSDVFFGWAKPVPVDTRNFKNPDKDHMLVSFAGPAVNLIIAMVCMIILVSVILLTRLLWPGALSLNLVDPFEPASLTGFQFSKGLLVFILFLKKLFYTSLILGFFNLLPIPPLDGSRILAGVLPERLRGIFDFLRRFGFMLFILLAMTPVFDYVLGIPIGVAWLGLRWVVLAMGFA